MPTPPPRMQLGQAGAGSHPACGCSGSGCRSQEWVHHQHPQERQILTGSPGGPGSPGWPCRDRRESQELKREGLAPPSPAPLLCELLKFTPPWTQSQCPLVAKYSITQFLHPCIPSTVTGLVPAWPGPAGSRRGRWEPGAAAPEQLLTYFKSWPADGPWLPFRSRQALQGETAGGYCQRFCSPTRRFLLGLFPPRGIKGY